jgi:hypothetical protein
MIRWATRAGSARFAMHSHPPKMVTCSPSTTITKLMKTGQKRIDDAVDYIYSIGELAGHVAPCYRPGMRRGSSGSCLSGLVATMRTIRSTPPTRRRDDAACAVAVPAGLLLRSVVEIVLVGRARHRHNHLTQWKQTSLAHRPRTEAEIVQGISPSPCRRRALGRWPTTTGATVSSP